LEWSSERGFREVHLHTDSQLMAEQLNGNYRVRSDRIKPLFEKVKRALEGSRWTITHHGRDNPWIMLCDSMVNDVLDGAQDPR